MKILPILLIALISLVGQVYADHSSFHQGLNEINGKLDGSYDAIVDTSYGYSWRYNITQLPKNGDDIIVKEPITLSLSELDATYPPNSCHISVYCQEFNSNEGSTEYNEFNLSNTDQVNKLGIVSIGNFSNLVPIHYIPDLTIVTKSAGSVTLEFKKDFQTEVVKTQPGYFWSSEKKEKVTRTITVKVPVTIVP